MHSIFFLAIAAGFLTILAPCILPLLPFLLGTSGGRSPWRPLMIVLGFVGTFAVVGAALNAFGSFLGLGGTTLRFIAVGFLLLFGLALLFEHAYETVMAKLQPVLAKLGTKVAGTAAVRKDALSGLLVGVSLGIIWTPCAGPILGVILTLASQHHDYLSTMLLLLAYALGAGVPMLGIAYGGHALQKRFASVGRWQSTLNKVFGVIVIATALLLFFNLDLVLLQWLTERFTFVTSIL